MLWLRKKLLKKTIVICYAIQFLFISFLYAMENVSPAEGASPAKQIIQLEIDTLTSEISLSKSLLILADMDIAGEFKCNHTIHSSQKRKALCEIILASNDSEAQIALAESIVTERTGPLRFELDFKRHFCDGTPLNEKYLELHKKKIQRYLKLQKALLEQKAKAQQSAVVTRDTRTIPERVTLSTDLYDMTERWQVMFGIDGKLEILKARRDARSAARDGFVHSSFQAKSKLPGLYTFVFIRVDNFDQTYQVHAVRLYVKEGIKNSKPATISPESKFPKFQHRVSVAPNEPVMVRWDYYPGGEGIRGGWKLMKTIYSSSNVAPAVPGYENAIGE